MTFVHVSHLSSALGDTAQSVEEAARRQQLVSPATALRAAGFERHHVCSDDQTAYDLARAAFIAANIDPANVDAIVYSTCLPLNGSIDGVGNGARFAAEGDVKALMQFPASRLQADFAMHDAIVIGLNQQACTGMLGALRIARNLLLAESDMSNVVCITADRFPVGAKYEQAYNLISDGAAACLVSRREQGFRLLDVHHISNGAMVSASDDETVGSYFNYTARLVEQALARLELQLSDIRWVVPQNTNAKAWTILSRLLGLEPEQAFFPSMAETGHVISADNIINLAGLRASGKLQSGDRVLTLMAGFGSNWQGAILEAV
jgi:3-oxoacyl-[acyl-carrier-protein] synthase-3